MSLHQHNAEEMVTKHAPPAVETGAETTGDAPRYEPETVQQVIALAAQMQTRHRETLSPDDIIALGREVGVEPEFVRRALAEVEVPAKKTAARRGQKIRIAPVTRRQWATATIPLALYVLFPLLPDALGWTRFSGASVSWVYFALPVLLAFGIGAASKSKRLGMVYGGLTGLLSLAALLIPQLNAASENGLLFSAYFPSLVSLLTISVSLGMVLGLAGAALRQFMSGPRRVKRIRVVIERYFDKTNARQ